MISLQEKRVINRDLATCFRYLSDFSTIEQWDPGVYRAEKATAGSPVVGGRFELILNSAGRRVPMTYVLEKLEAPVQGRAFIELSGKGESFSAYDWIELEAKGDEQTVVTYRADLVLSQMALKLAPLLNPWLHQVGKKALDGMQSALALQTEPKPLSGGQKLAYKTIVPAARYFTQRGYLAMPHKGLNEYMDGKTVVVTGPTAGLGLAASCELARLGARVVLVGRNRDRLQAAQAQIINFSAAKVDQLPIYVVDMENLAEVVAVAAEIAKVEQKIDVLVNNAGALFADRALTSGGYERALAVDLLAPYLFTQRLLPRLQASSSEGSPARVINVVSGGMYLQPLKLTDLNFEQGQYDGTKAYARAKRGLMAVTQHWAKQLPQVEFSAMHPGWAATPGVEKSLPAFNKKMAKRLRDSRMGADTIVWLASSQAALGRSGALWLDRQVVPTDVVAKTVVQTEQQLSLVNWLERQAAKF